MSETRRKQKMLLHACCAPCSGPVLEDLQDAFEITLYYFNPNIHPQGEYQIRRKELARWCETINIPVVFPEYCPQVWFDMVKGYEKEPERGDRCTICYRMRMENTAQYAQKKGFDFFTTVLSISPHKDADRINMIGQELAQKYGLNFFEANFKKKGGFQRSLQISKKNNFYRQNYCGCIFSIRKDKQTETGKKGK
jgi:predicted adenine nucleotide alpha hydrolase (AANH) superfamily ATPase